MADETKTKDQLLAELKTALDSGDFKAVAKVSREIDKLTVGEEKAEKEAKLAVVTDLTAKVKKVLDKALGTIDFPPEADGVWYSNDFGEALTSCRLVKGAVRKASGGGGGGGKKFSISTNELLQRHGSDEMGESGKTFQEAYDEDTAGNSRPGSSTSGW